MPIYEYRCPHCGHIFEKLQKSFKDPAPSCPRCHAEQTERLISSTHFQLKGSGWYATDYKSKPVENKQKSSSQKSSKAAQSSESSQQKTA